MDALSLAVLVSQALTSTAAVPAEAPVDLRPLALERFAVPAAQDTGYTYSDAYYRRLDVHRAGSYAMLPLFAFQYLAGTQLYDKSFEAPAWAKTGHRIAATGVAVLFTVNTVTGLMNLYAGRRDPDDRKRKLFHALMMLTADAGFTATGILAERAERSGDDRTRHRTMALTSIGVATIGYLAMTDLFRRD